MKNDKCDGKGCNGQDCSGQDCSGCEAGAVKPAMELSRIGGCVAVMSGKGGVGKSLVTGLLAVGLRRQGRKAGILDADITGPSIPKMFGVGERPATKDFGILPVRSRSGIDIMSLNLFMENEDDPVIWRGPMISNAVRQFWEEVVWGDLDYLLLDLPPGTADVALTVMQVLPLKGVVIVMSPQDLTVMIVKKAIKMADMLKIPVLGLIENMSYIVCPGCNEEVEVFGPSRGAETAASQNIPFWGRLPIDPALAALCDSGRIEDYDDGFPLSLARHLTGEG
ncbi:MAG: Mrp/NBP35 family ATP-binding protein [bacterium]|jgi:Mrp family chromosome partitioning ATPase|nr:Mrp/NBP35 family ATP-binding protein [bacterium]MDD3805736.1 Mrp/NBP35 family ATP-binding protein [bacterium]MDD4557518.1 Mrp/NBP35 family ATP-binding protein [bacterium]